MNPDVKAVLQAVVLGFAGACLTWWVATMAWDEFWRILK